MQGIVGFGIGAAAEGYAAIAGARQAGRRWRTRLAREQGWVQQWQQEWQHQQPCSAADVGSCHPARPL